MGKDASELRNLTDRELLWELFGEVKELRGDVENYQGRLDERCETRCAKIERQENTLYGNGRAGLVVKVTMLWWVLGFVATALSGSVGGIVLHLLAKTHGN